MKLALMAEPGWIGNDEPRRLMAWTNHLTPTKGTVKDRKK